MLQSQNLVSSSVVAIQSGYRVMLLRANGEVGLVCFAKTHGNAQRIARKACQKHLARLTADWRRINSLADRPRMVYVEVWQGTPTHGTWISPRRNGFQFEFHDRSRDRRKRKPATRWETGSLVKCVLLPARTRKGGWRAEIAGTGHQGPVTNWQDIPPTFTTGTEVDLKLCGISAQTGAAQFAWQG